MLTANFKGRKNARRVNALAINKQQLELAKMQHGVAAAIAAGNGPSKEQVALREQAIEHGIFLAGKIQRIQKCIANLEAKIMPQAVAESLRSKKYRGAGSR